MSSASPSSLTSSGPSLRQPSSLSLSHCVSPSFPLDPPSFASRLFCCSNHPHLSLYPSSHSHFPRGPLAPLVSPLALVLVGESHLTILPSFTPSSLSSSYRLSTYHGPFYVSHLLARYPASHHRPIPHHIEQHFHYHNSSGCHPVPCTEPNRTSSRAPISYSASFLSLTVSVNATSTFLSGTVYIVSL